MSDETRRGTQHTPGPWKVRAIPDGTRLSVIDANGEWVADARPWSMSQRALYEQAANARLIAAAPQLLEVCRRAVAGLSTGACMTCGAEPGANIDCPGCLWVLDAEQAIAIAEGRS